MPYGDLLGYLRISRGHHDIYNSGEKKPTSRLTDTELLSFAWMIADGMSYLADMRVNLHHILSSHTISMLRAYFKLVIIIIIVVIAFNVALDTVL